MMGALHYLAEYYDEFYTKLFDYGLEIEILDSVLKGDFTKKVIDLGCGTGLHLIGLVSKSGYECVGIDKSMEMIIKARQNAKDADVSIEFVRADIRDSASLKEYHRAFDASIWIRNTLSSVDNVGLALKTNCDLLKNGGIVILDLLQAEENACEDEILNMDIITRNEATVIRLNNFQVKSSEVHYQSVYFIQREGAVQIVPHQLVLPLINVDDIKRILASLGLKYESVIHEYIGIPKTKSIMILARKENND